MNKQPILEKIEKLNKETENIYSSLEGLNEEDLKNTSCGWSIIQVFSHLNMAEWASVLYMKKKMNAGDKMPSFSTMSRVRYSFTRGLLQSSLKWKAPSVVSKPNGNYTLEQIKEEWANTRKMTKEYVEEYPEELINKAVYKHPFAGRLDLAGAIDSFIYHQRHHVHQIKRIRKKIGC